MTAGNDNTGGHGSPPTIAFGLGRDMIGLVIGGEFTIVRPLAEGGMGAVFVVAQKSTGKERALKLMHREIAADPDFKRRFEQEAQVGSRIRSEHVVEVLAAGVDERSGLPYLVMELLEGEDLRHRLARGPLAPADARSILEQLCHAMTAAHAAGVVHRDLKPENVFLARSRRAGGELTVKVLDFGIAKLVLESSTRAATRGAVGSPLWMAPEQTTPGPVNASADVWSLGLLTYEMLVGKSYWRTANRDGGNTLQLLREIVLEPLSYATDRAAEYQLADRLPPGFDAWFAQCIVREPAERFVDASALWRALPSMLASAPSSLAVTGVQVLGATSVAKAGITPTSHASQPSHQNLADTGAATPFVSSPPGQAVSAPPFTAAPRANERSAGRGVPPETPIVTVQEVQETRRDAETTTTAPKGNGGGNKSNAVVALAAIAAVAVGVAIWSFTRQPSSSPIVTTPPSAPSPSTALVMIPTVTADPSIAPAPVVSTAHPAATTSVAVRTAPPSAGSPSTTTSNTAAAAASASAKPRAPLAGGFTDPTDRNGAVTWKVQDRHVRLFSRLVSNDSNVADRVVRSAVEHNSWEYLRCYERIFGGAKDLPEGTISVSFDILDQLPRHAKLVSSTFTSDSFNDCVVRTLVGQTINAAGPDGKGHAVEGFRFVPN